MRLKGIEAWKHKQSSLLSKLTSSHFDLSKAI